MSAPPWSSGNAKDGDWYRLCGACRWLDPLSLTVEEVRLVLAAIDSHVYWQLADATNRNDGAVIEDTLEMLPFRVLEERLTKVTP